MQEAGVPSRSEKPSAHLSQVSFDEQLLQLWILQVMQSPVRAVKLALQTEQTSFSEHVWQLGTLQVTHPPLESAEKLAAQI